MRLASLTFNNFFDYLIIAEQVHTKTKWVFNPNEFMIIFPYTLTAEFAIKYVESLCNPLNIQFTTSLEVVKDTE